MRLTYRIVLLLAIGVCIGYGCSRTHTDTEDNKKAKATRKGDAAEGKSKKSKTSKTSRVVLPEGFPKDVPVYPDATLVPSGPSTKGTTVTLKTADTVQQVDAYYKGRLKKSGWNIEGSIKKHFDSTWFATKDSSRLTILISIESDRTMINLTVTDEKGP